MIQSLERFILVFCLAFLTACGGSSSSRPATDISGLIANDRLANAQVQVFDPEGNLLAEVRSDEQGQFMVKVRPPHPYYLVHATGGHKVGASDTTPYSGELRARCTAPIRPRDGLQCDVTPWTTLIALLMSQGYSNDEAQAMLQDVVGTNRDPFADAGQGEPVDEQQFDLDAARDQIGNGDGLAAWLDDLAQWVTGQSDTAPAGAPRYTLTVTAGEGGTFSPSPVQVRRGDRVSINIQPAQGYEVDSVTGCGGSLAGDTYTTGPVFPDETGALCDVVMTFALRHYQLDYGADHGGTLSGDASQSVAHGSDGSAVTAVPDAGFHFIQWSDGLAHPARTDTNVQQDLALTASFALNQYNLSYRADTGGSLSDDSSQTVSHGSDGSAVTAVADFGYQFAQWSDGLATASRTETNVQQDLALTARFALNQYNLSYRADTGGSISGDNSQTVSHGHDGTLVTASPDTGFSFVQWSDGATSAGRTDSNVLGDLTVTASFELMHYAINYHAGVGGSISGPASQQVAHGGNSRTVTAVADFGYEFDEWSDGLTTASRSESNVSGPVNRTARFELKRYNLSYSAGTGGTLSGDANQTVTHGADGSTVTAVADFGYEFDDWSDGLTTASRSESNVQQDLSLTAGFALKRYNLSYSAGTGGTLSGDANQTVTHGADGSTVTAVADFGYQFDDWSDGLTTASRSESSVQQDLALTAGFEPLLPIPQNLQATAGVGQVMLNWDPVAGATGYNLYYGTQPDIDPGNYAASGATLVIGVPSGVTIISLDNDTTYFFKVTATTATLEGPGSEVRARTVFVPVGGLNDTGIDWCADNLTNYSQAGTPAQKQAGCDSVAATHPGQDGMSGRDAQARASTLTKVGSGAASFDYTKVCNSGEIAGQVGCPADPALGAGVNDWACTRDNVSGLIWEVKTTDAGLRNAGNTYSWYSTDVANNGGDAGTANGGSCTGSDCDTQAFVAAVNAAGLCGANDWRLPTVQELHSLEHAGRHSPAIDVGFFPNTPSGWFWSSSPYAESARVVWGVGFGYGGVNTLAKDNVSWARLVRAGQ